MKKEIRREGAHIMEPTDSLTASANESHSRHSPLPWFAGASNVAFDGHVADGSVFPVISSGHGEVLARLRYVRDGRVMAAAPEMLAAIRAFLAKWEEVEPRIGGMFAMNFARTNAQYNGPTVDAELTALREAIAKAEGR